MALERGMTLQLCPKCGHRRFSWWIDEDVSPLTQWRCGHCRYSAEEDESRESTCPACGAERSRMLLADPNGRYWFCLSCQSRARYEVAD